MVMPCSIGEGSGVLNFSDLLFNGVLCQGFDDCNLASARAYISPPYLD